MRGADEVEKLLFQRLFVSLPSRIGDEHSNLIQLKLLGVVQVTFRNRWFVLKPVFSMSDGFGRLVIESSDAAQILWYTTLRSHRHGKGGNEHRYRTVVSSH
jgi:hypothetical protein